MLLSNTGILRHLRETKAILIEPFDEDALGNVSYDLTLGKEIARYAWGTMAVDLERRNPATLFNVEEARTQYADEGGLPGFHLRPGERVLGHSREIAGGRQVPAVVHSPHGLGGLVHADVAVTTQLHATSTAARIGLQVCGCAGFGDVGFTSPWVFEITNMSPRRLWLPVGAVIAQVSFAEVEPLIDGTSYESKGSYQSAPTVDPAELLRTWRLRDGLPKKLKVRP